MQPMWLCLFSGKQFEDTFENAHWRKVKQMQPMWLCLFSGRQFEETFENAQWSRIIQMQPMWVCIFSGRQFEETFENPQWRKVKPMQPMWLCNASSQATLIPNVQPQGAVFKKGRFLVLWGNSEAHLTLRGSFLTQRLFSNSLALLRSVAQHYFKFMETLIWSVKEYMTFRTQNL